MQISIGLALHMNADLLVIDELDGRAEARYQSIPIAGMIGIFKLAKDRNFIVSVKPYLGKLRLTNFKMSPKLYQLALMDAGELSTPKKA